MSPRHACSHCAGPVPADTQACPTCGRPVERRAAKAAVETQERTATYAVPLGGRPVPRLRVLLETEPRLLHAFEAHVAAYADGKRNLCEVARAAGVSEVEVWAVVETLHARL